MYDPIPWHIDEIDAKRRGLSRAGWYVIGYDGRPVVGPHDEPEGCIMALHELPDELCRALPLQPSMPRGSSVTA
jgi:hypothetical protein